MLQFIQMRAYLPTPVNGPRLSGPAPVRRASVFSRLESIGSSSGGGGGSFQCVFTPISRHPSSRFPPFTFCSGWMTSASKMTRPCWRLRYLRVQNCVPEIFSDKFGALWLQVAWTNLDNFWQYGACTIFLKLIRMFHFWCTFVFTIYQSNYFIVRLKVDEIAGQLSLPHLTLFAFR